MKMIRQCKMKVLFHQSLILFLMNISINNAVQFNHQCTFSLDTCDWNIGRRWQVKTLDDNNDDKVLIVTDRNNQDKEKGFTDVITTSWLDLTSICSYEIRLTFQYNIENEYDQIEVFLIKKASKEILSLGQWKAITNEKIFEDIESFWQQVNLTFKADDSFRIEIETRHFPDDRFDSTTWFALDDILIEHCPNLQTTPSTTTSTISTQTYMNTTNATLDDFTFRFYRHINHTYDNSLPPRLSLLSFILYTISTLIGLILVVIILAFIIFKYRQHCLPKSNLSQPILNYRHHSSRREKSQHLDPDTRTIITTIR